MSHHFHFENPDLLHLLWVLLLQGLMLWWYWHWRRRTLHRLGSPQLEARLLLGFSTRRFWLKNILFAVVGMLIVTGIANPRRVETHTPPPKSSSDILIALDVSRSMLAGDVAPSRLKRAQQLSSDLIKTLPDDRIGLMVFAGDAFPQAPLTNDPAALLMFVGNASPESVNDQGTNFKSVLDLATRMFPPSEAGKALIIISDGENHQPDAVAAAENARKEGITIYTVLAGTAAGSTIPGPGNEPLRNYEGQVVRTRTDEVMMSEIARTGGGIALKLSDETLSQLTTALQQLRKTTVEMKEYQAYTSYYQWLILPALLLLIIDQLIPWQKKAS